MEHNCWSFEALRFLRYTIQKKRSITKFNGKKCTKKNCISFCIRHACYLQYVSNAWNFRFSSFWFERGFDRWFIEFHFDFLHFQSFAPKAKTPNIKFDMDFHKITKWWKQWGIVTRKKQRAQWTSFLRVYLLINDGRKMKFSSLYEGLHFIPFTCALCFHAFELFVSVNLLLALVQLWIIVWWWW